LNFKWHSKSYTKLIILVSVLLASVVLLTSCVSGMTPVGWSGVTIKNGVVYTCSKEGRLVTYNPADGSRMWAEALKSTTSGSGSCSLGGGTSSGAGGCGGGTPAIAIYGTPALAGDLVYIAGYNGKIYAYNDASLQPRWVYPREGNLSPIVSSIVISGNLLYFGCTDKKLYALDVTTGDFKWEFLTDGEIWASPAVDNGMVFITSFDKKVYALDAVTGVKKWEFNTSATNIATPVAFEGILYVGSLDRNLYALNENDGSVAWKYTADNWFWSKPVIYNGFVFAPCLDNKVYGFNVKTGEKKFEYNVEGQTSSWPIVADSRPIVEGQTSQPTVADTRLIVATQNGKLWSLSTDPANTVDKQLNLGTIPEQVTAPLASVRTAAGTIIYVNGPDNNLRLFNLTTKASLPSISIKSEQ
jgi:eukaryotic-like serine/threonine-protein kinase